MPYTGTCCTDCCCLQPVYVCLLCFSADTLCFAINFLSRMQIHLFGRKFWSKSLRSDRCCWWQIRESYCGYVESCFTILEFMSLLGLYALMTIVLNEPQYNGTLLSTQWVRTQFSVGMYRITGDPDNPVGYRTIRLCSVSGRKFPVFPNIASENRIVDPQLAQNGWKWRVKRLFRRFTSIFRRHRVRLFTADWRSSNWASYTAHGRVCEASKTVRAL